MSLCEASSAFRLKAFRIALLIELVKKINGLKIVTNIFNSGLQEYDKNMAYISLEKAQILFGNGANDITGLIVEESSSSSINVHYPFYFETWKERHALLFEWMTVQQWPAYIMFGLIIFVGLVNLFAAIAMIIIEKNSSIALLLTQGIPDVSLKNVFVAVQ